MTAAFVSELIRAANETERLTKAERARLLERAAATLREYRRAINYSETPANDGGPGDAASEWTEMARLIPMFSAAECGGCASGRRRSDQGGAGAAGNQGGY